MAEDTTDRMPADAAVEDAVDTPVNDAGIDQSAWSTIWQLPVLLLGVVMLGAGTFLAMPGSDAVDFPGAMDNVEHYFAANNLEAAEEQLKAIQEHIEDGSKQDRARHHVLCADLAYHRQSGRAWESPDDHQEVVEQYEQAERLGHDFEADPARLQRWAETLVALGRPDNDVMPLLDRMPAEPARRRHAVLRQIIERRRASRPPSPPSQLAGALARFLDELSQETDPSIRRAQELWGLGVQAAMFLEADDPAAAVDFLNPRRAALASRGSDDDMGPLMVLTAQSHQRMGEFDEAEREYRHAQLTLAADESDPRHAEILVGLGQIALTQDHDLERAVELFGAAVSRFPTTTVYPEALIGLADCEARRGAHGRACELMGRAVTHLAAEAVRSADQVKALVDTALTHHELLTDAGRPDLAIDYLSVLTGRFDDELPADLMLRFAVTHEAIATRLLEDARSNDVTASTGTATSTPNQREIASHFAKAGDFYARHAEAVTIVDDIAHGDSLWKAASCYDQARLWDKAITTLKAFQLSRPGDARHMEATQRLALAYQAAGQVQTAADLLQSFIEKNPQSPQAYSSRVPLARCHVSLNNVNAALSVLNDVLTNNDAITPQSAEYREALIELGKLHFHMEEYELACRSLEEAVERYAESPEAAVLHSYLGDAYRKSVARIDEDLAGPLVDSRTETLRTQRDERLERAMSAYGVAIDVLESRDETARSKLEQVLLRNNYFYRADCAYARNRYVEAIEWYDLAAKRWEQHPVTLVALIQIVNAYCALNQFEDAKAAVNRTRYAFEQMGEDVFDDPNLPITRKHWQDWFRWTAELDMVRQANAGDGP